MLPFSTKRGDVSVDGILSLSETLDDQLLFGEHLNEMIIDQRAVSKN